MEEQSHPQTLTACQHGGTVALRLVSIVAPIISSQKSGPPLQGLFAEKSHALMTIKIQKKLTKVSEM